MGISFRIAGELPEPIRMMDSAYRRGVALQKMKMLQPLIPYMSQGDRVRLLNAPEFHQLLQDAGIGELPEFSGQQEQPLTPLDQAKIDYYNAQTKRLQEPGPKKIPPAPKLVERNGRYFEQVYDQDTGKWDEKPLGVDVSKVLDNKLKLAKLLGSKIVTSGRDIYGRLYVVVAGQDGKPHIKYVPNGNVGSSINPSNINLSPSGKPFTMPEGGGYFFGGEHYSNVPWTKRAMDMMKYITSYAKSRKLLGRDDQKILSYLIGAGAGTGSYAPYMHDPGFFSSNQQWLLPVPQWIGATFQRLRDAAKKESNVPKEPPGSFGSIPQSDPDINFGGTLP